MNANRWRIAKIIISKQIRRELKPTEMSPRDMYLVGLMTLAEVRKSSKIYNLSVLSITLLGG